MGFNYMYKCNDCGFRWHDVSPVRGRGFIRCMRCESKNVECLTSKITLDLKLHWWGWLIISTVSSIIVGSVVTYVYFYFFDTFNQALWWVIPIGFIGGFTVPAILWISDYFDYMLFRRKTN